MNAFFGSSLHAAGRHRAAIDLHERAAKANPGSMMPYLLRAIPNHALGNDARAFEALKIAHELMPEQAPPGIAGHVAYGYKNVGRDDEARRLWAQVEATMGDQFIDPNLRLWGCRCKGDRAGALGALRKAVEQPQYRQEIFLRTFVKQNNWHDPVIDEPEFAALRSRLAMT